MNRYKHDLILQTATEIAKYIDGEFNINTDIYSIFDLIEINLGNELDNVEDYRDEQ